MPKNIKRIARFTTRPKTIRKLWVQGDSFAITIPPPMVHALRVAAGGFVVLRATGGRIVLTKYVAPGRRAGKGVPHGK